MKTVFADTYYYLALLSQDDAAHRKAVEYARSSQDRVLRTEWVLTEIADGLAAPEQRHVFVALRASLQHDVNLTVVASNAELFGRGCDFVRSSPG